MNESKQPSGFADFGNRLVAQSIDLALLFVMAISLTGTLESPMHLDRGQVTALQNWLQLGLGFFYFALFPLTRLQGSPGKWLVGIRLRDRIGNPPTRRQSMVRASAMLLWYGVIPQLGWLTASHFESLDEMYWSLYPVWAYLPYASMAFLDTRQSLFDLASGTVVATRNAGRLDVPAEASARSRKPLRIIGALFCYLVLFGMTTVPLQVVGERSLRARTEYAIEQTNALREKAGQFRAREGRWPVAGDAGVPASTPYPHGGSYRTLGDGSIEIAFAVKPGLKGRTIMLRPRWVAEEARAEWKCVPDPALRRGLLPYMCRK